MTSIQAGVTSAAAAAAAAVSSSSSVSAATTTAAHVPAITAPALYIPPVVRVRPEMDVNGSCPVPEYHQSYLTKEGAPLPLIVSNNADIHDRTCTFEYQPLGGTVTVKPEIVQPLADMIAGRWNREYKFDAGRLWGPHIREYKRMETSVNTYVESLGNDSCPVMGFDYIFGEKRNPIYPLITTDWMTDLKIREDMIKGYPTASSLIGNNPKIAYDYAWLILLQLWLHVNERWMERIDPTSDTPLHIFILHSHDFEHSSRFILTDQDASGGKASALSAELPPRPSSSSSAAAAAAAGTDELPESDVPVKVQDLRAYVKLQGADLAACAAKLSVSAFIAVVMSKLRWEGGRSLYDSVKQNDTMHTSLIHQLIPKRFVPLRYDEAVVQYYNSAFDLARVTMEEMRIEAGKDAKTMTTEAVAAGISRSLAGPLKANEKASIVNKQITSHSSAHHLQIDIDRRAHKPPLLLCHSYFRPDTSVFTFFERLGSTHLDRYECITWQLPRFLNERELKEFEKEAKRVFQRDKSFFTRLSEPAWLCSRSASARYACFKGPKPDPNMYLVHPYKIALNSTAGLSAFSQPAVVVAAASSSSSDQKQKSPSAVVHSTYAASAASAAASLVNSRKRKSGVAELDARPGGKPVTDLARVQEMLRTISPIHSNRQSVISPVSVDIPRLIYMWKRNTAVPSVWYPKREECIRIMAHLKDRELIYRILYLYQNSYRESAVWWVLFHSVMKETSDPFNPDSARGFFTMCELEWDQSLTVLWNQTAYALYRACPWSPEHLELMLSRMRDVFNITESCDDVNSHSMRVFNWDFDRTFFTVPVLRQIVKESRILVKGRTDADMDRFLSLLVGVLSTGTLNAAEPMLHAPFTIEGDLSPTHTLVEEIVDVWMRFVKRPIFSYFMYAANPSTGNRLGTSTSEWRGSDEKLSTTLLPAATQITPSAAPTATAAPIFAIPKKPLPFTLNTMKNKVTEVILNEIQDGRISGRNKPIKPRNHKYFETIMALTPEHIRDDPTRAAFFISVYGAALYGKAEAKTTSIQLERILSEKKSLLIAACQIVGSLAGVDSKEMIFPDVTAAATTTIPTAAASGFHSAAFPSRVVNAADHKFTVVEQQAISKQLSFYLTVKRCINLEAIHELSKLLYTFIPFQLQANVAGILAQQIRTHCDNYGGHTSMDEFICRYTERLSNGRGYLLYRAPMGEFEFPFSVIREWFKSEEPGLLITSHLTLQEANLAAASASTATITAPVSASAAGPNVPLLLPPPLPTAEGSSAPTADTMGQELFSMAGLSSSTPLRSSIDSDVKMSKAASYTPSTPVHSAFEFPPIEGLSGMTPYHGAGGVVMPKTPMHR